jgi:hypothetical protein
MARTPPGPGSQSETGQSETGQSETGQSETGQSETGMNARQSRPGNTGKAMKQQKHQGKSLSCSPWETARLRLAAARFHLVETLAGQKIWQDGMAWRRRWFFWMTLAGMTGKHAPDTTGTWMPGLAAAIRQESDLGVLGALSDFPLPDPLPTPLEPFRAFMMEIWANHPAAHDDPMSLAARVRLDSLGGEQGGAHLETWLAMARHILSSGGTDQEIRLGCLARWRPGTASRPDPKTLARWNAFWNVYGKDFDANPVIAIQARLNLAGSRSSISTSEAAKLLDELAELIHEADSPEFREVPPLSQWLIWQPRATTPLPPGGLRRVARAWLEKTNLSKYTADTRQNAWTILTSWDREGLLARSGIDLGPELARTLEKETDEDVLAVLARWTPSPSGGMFRPEVIHRVARGWQTLGETTGNEEILWASWYGQGGLLTAGALTEAGKQHLCHVIPDTVKTTPYPLVLLALLPSATALPEGCAPWMDRWHDSCPDIRLVAGIALWHHLQTGSLQTGAMADAPARQRQWRQQLREVGQRMGVPFVTERTGPGNRPATARLPDFYRLCHIETVLSAGQMPIPQDSGAGDRTAGDRTATRIPHGRLPENPPCRPRHIPEKKTPGQNPCPRSDAAGNTAAGRKGQVEPL